MDDSQLLRRFVADRAEDAFAELVRRHLPLVYHSALRRTAGDTHRAEEIAQRVFLALARKAPTLLGHTALAGWLHTATQFAAREDARATARRHQREQEAHAMHEDCAPEPEPAWEQIRPVIDEALHTLEPRDRDAVLLRFFENRAYAEIGAALHLTENAARMRVDRALEKLRLALGARGVTSTTAALAGALTTPAALAVPAGLAEHITASALAATATGAGLTLVTLLKIMTSAKATALAAGLAALVASGLAVREHRARTATQAALTTLQSQHDRQQALIDNLEWRLAAAQEHGNRAESTPNSPAPARSAAAVLAAPAHPVTHDLVEARLKKARELAKAGQSAAALDEFLWCYDTGTRQVDGYFIYRYSSLLEAIADLGKNYPLALDALRQRRDAAKIRLLASPTDLAAGKDFGQINRVLGEDHVTNALFDAMAEDDPRRGFIIESSLGRLMETQRYRELAKAMPYTDIPQTWEQMVGLAHSPAPSEEARQNRSRGFVNFAAMQIELRAGAGDVVSASDMIERLLIFDSSPETVATIKQRLGRAGHPELFKEP